MKKGRGGSTVFLLELVLDLLIFAICAVICVSLLLHANHSSKQSSDLTEASFLAQSAAELFQVEEDAQLLADKLSGTLDGQTLRVYYDAQWAPTSDTQAPYAMELQLSDGGALQMASIVLTEAYTGEAIFELTASRVEGVSAS